MKEKLVQLACRVPVSYKKWLKKESKRRKISEAKVVREIINQRAEIE